MAARSRVWPDPRVKPPYGAAELDRGHPLTQHLSIHWVMNEGGGATVLDPVRAQDGTLSGTTKPGWRASGRGLGLEFDGSTGYVVNRTVLNAARVTLAAQFRVVTLPGSASQRRICGFANGIGSGTNDKELMISRTAGTTNIIEWHVFDTGAKFATDLGGALVAKSTHVFVGTADATTARIYRDGVETNNLAAGATFAGYTVANIFAGGNTSASGFLNQVVDWMAVWTEALPAGHVLWLSAEPYAMYRPRVRRRYFVPAAGTSIPVKMHHYAGMR
jgi:hypothetical protein